MQRGLNLKIKLKKPTQPELLLWLIILLPFFFGTLIGFLHLPNAIRYTCDFCWLGMLGMLLAASPKVERPVKVLIVWIVSFLAITLLVYLFNYQSILYYLWGARNNFRHYVFFLGLIVYFRKEDVESVLRILDTLFWINAVISLIQYFLLGYDGDHLGGLFGVSTGANAYTCIFFLIITTKSVIYCLNNEETLAMCIAKCGTALVICAFAELKFFYMIFAVMIATASLVTKFTWKKLLVIFGGIAGISVTAALLVKIFPSFANFLTMDAILDMAGSERGYTSSGDLNRLNSIPIIITNFLQTTELKLFGLGLGNCDTSAFAFLNTPFYDMYSWLHYSWMSISFMFLENGFVGLTFSLGFFVLVFFLSGSSRKADNARDRMSIQITKIMAVCCPLIAIYNSSLREEAGYMVYFVLAMGFIASRRTNRRFVRRRRITM